MYVLILSSLLVLVSGNITFGLDLGLSGVLLGLETDPGPELCSPEMKWILWKSVSPLL